MLKTTAEKGFSANFEQRTSQSIRKLVKRVGVSLDKHFSFLCRWTRNDLCVFIFVFPVLKLKFLGGSTETQSFKKLKK